MLEVHLCYDKDTDYVGSDGKRFQCFSALVRTSPEKYSSGSELNSYGDTSTHCYIVS